MLSRPLSALRIVKARLLTARIIVRSSYACRVYENTRIKNIIINNKIN